MIKGDAVMKLSRFLVFLAIVLLTQSPAVAAVIAQSDKEVQAIADPILDTLLSGFNDNNYSTYSQYFDDTLKDAIPEKKFQQVRSDILQKMGKYQSRTYLGYQTKGNFTVVLWKGRFSKSTDDVLIKLAVSKRGDKVEVSGLWFQ
jgi:hypothetical protein